MTTSTDRRSVRGRAACAALLLAVFGALVAHSAGAAEACAALPPSILRVYDIKVPALEELWVPAEELDRAQPADGLAPRHTMMLTSSDLVVLFEITHRIVPQADGSVCDAPSLVRIGLGLSRRVAYLASIAAADACVRQAMLAHEAAHTRLLNETVDRFIDQQQADLRRGMRALKETPAPTAAIAKARWEGGLRALVVEAKRQLLVAARIAGAAVDDVPALAALADACAGKIRQLRERNRGF